MTTTRHPPVLTHNIFFQYPIFPKFQVSLGNVRVRCLWDDEMRGPADVYVVTILQTVTMTVVVSPWWILLWLQWPWRHLHQWNVVPLWVPVVAVTSDQVPGLRCHCDQVVSTPVHWSATAAWFGLSRSDIRVPDHRKLININRDQRKLNFLILMILQLTTHLYQIYLKLFGQ